MKGSAPSSAFITRHKATRKWLIAILLFDTQLKTALLGVYIVYQQKLSVLVVVVIDAPRIRQGC